jgi:hypothetical protein
MFNTNGGYSLSDIAAVSATTAAMAELSEMTGLGSSSYYSAVGVMAVSVLEAETAKAPFVKKFLMVSI